MHTCDSHCPFLNRNDDRCANHFQVTDLQYAFRFCFNNYKACPSYLEQLVERRVRRITSNAVAQSQVSLTIAGRTLDRPAHAA